MHFYFITNRKDFIRFQLFCKIVFRLTRVFISPIPQLELAPIFFRVRCAKQSCCHLLKHSFHYNRTNGPIDQLCFPINPRNDSVLLQSETSWQFAGLFSLSGLLRCFRYVRLLYPKRTVTFSKDTYCGNTLNVLFFDIHVCKMFTLKTICWLKRTQ